MSLKVKFSASSKDRSCLVCRRSCRERDIYGICCNTKGVTQLVLQRALTRSTVASVENTEALIIVTRIVFMCLGIRNKASAAQINKESLTALRQRKHNSRVFVENFLRPITQTNIKTVSIPATR